jgi:predicted ATPase
LSHGAQLLSLAERAQDPALLLQAYHALGPAYGFAGDWATGQSHLDAAIRYYDRQAHGSQAFTYGGHDPCVCCLSYLAQALWMLGLPEQASQRGEQSLELARELKHPTSLAHTQHSVAILHQFRRDVSETRKLTDALLTLASDQGLPFYLAGSLVLEGWALVESGQSDEGMSRIREGFAMGGATRAHWRSYLLATFADSCSKVGNFAEGLTLLAEAQLLVEQTGIRMYEPEICRLRGELLLEQDPGNLADAEACFVQAVAIARQHQAKSLELRATMSLARLRQDDGRSREARTALAAIYSTFTEGMATPDLVDVAAQLNRMT